jgi:hypothetical protein
MWATGPEADEADATNAVREAWTRTPEARSGAVGMPASHRRSRSHMAQARASGHGRSATPKRRRARSPDAYCKGWHPRARSPASRGETSVSEFKRFQRASVILLALDAALIVVAYAGRNPAHASAPWMTSGNARIAATRSCCCGAKQSQRRAPTGLPALRRGISNMRTPW